MIKNRYKILEQSLEKNEYSSKGRNNKNIVTYTIKAISVFKELLTLIIAIWGLFITIQVSKQSQKIEGFDNLLEDLKSLITTSQITNKSLNEQIALLNQELSALEKSRTSDSEHYRLAIEADINSLYITTFTLMNSGYYRNAEYLLDNREVLYKQIEIDRELFKKEISNQFLLKNKKVADLWLSTYKVLHYVKLVEVGQLTIVGYHEKPHIANEDEVRKHNLDEINTYIDNVRAAFFAANDYATKAYINMHK